MSQCRRVAIAILVACVVAWVAAAGTAWLHWPLPAGPVRVGAHLTMAGVFIAGLLWFMPGGFGDVATPALTRRYYREFAPPMIAYALVMFAWKPLLRSLELPWLRVAIALLPSLLVFLAIRAIGRYVRDSDELQRRIELESVGLAAGMVSTVYMTAGFLQSAKMLAIGAATAMLWVFPALCLFYGIARIAIARRYA